MEIREDKQIIKVQKDLEEKGYTCTIHKNILEISYCGLDCGDLFRVRNGLAYYPESLGRLASKEENNVGKYMKENKINIVFWNC